MDKKKINVTRLVSQAGLIAALYVVLTYFISAFNLASGAVQVRISEALCILPVFTPAAIPGLAVGCLLANLLTGGVIWDVVFGTVATIIGAIGTYYLRKDRFLSTLPPVVSNAVIIPFILKYAYHLEGAWWFFALTVGAGEAISVCVFGTILRRAIEGRYTDLNNLHL